MSDPHPMFETAPNLGVVHGFTTRYGGVSTGVNATLNLGENRGDDPDAVRENYARLARAMGFDTRRMVFSRQIHENTVLPVTWEKRHRLFEPVPDACDGLVTDEPGLALVIFTADCVPVLLYDPAKRAVGAVHAGWRGTVMDIVGHAVAVMAAQYGSRPEDIFAAIGPSISQCCFETGPEVPAAMHACFPAAADSFIRPGKTPDKTMVDLKGFNRALLMRAGVGSEKIWISPECTMCSHEKYWSHRYTHGLRGSQASVIVLPRS